MTAKKTNKRNIFAELMEGVSAMRQHREGKLSALLKAPKARPIPAQAEGLGTDAESKPEG